MYQGYRPRSLQRPAYGAVPGIEVPAGRTRVRGHTRRGPRGLRPRDPPARPTFPRATSSKTPSALPMAASRSSTHHCRRSPGHKTLVLLPLGGGRGRYLGGYLLFLDETVAVFSESERRDPSCATGRDPGPRVRSSDVHPQEPYICNGEEDRREDDQRREIPPDPDCHTFGGRRPCFRPTETVFGWKFSPGDPMMSVT